MSTEIHVRASYGLSGTIVLENLSPEFLAWALSFAISQATGHASNAGPVGSAESQNAATKKFNALLAGIVPQPGRGASSPKVSRESELLWDVVRDAWKETKRPMAELDRLCKLKDFEEDAKKHLWLDPIKSAMERKSKRSLTPERVMKQLTDEVVRRLNQGSLLEIIN